MLSQPKSRFQLIPAVHLFLLKGDRILLLRRAHTGYEDGNYSVPAGHLEGGETVTSAMCREAREEAGIIIQPGNLKFAHVMHRVTDAERLDLFFIAQTWEGEPQNLEPNKCDDLSWFPEDHLPDNTVPYIRAAIRHFSSHNHYSEYGWQ